MRHEVLGPSELFDARTLRTVHLHGGVALIGTRTLRPGSQNFGGAGLLLQQLGADLGRPVGVHVAPTFLPHRRLALPAAEPAGEQHLETLGERRLAAAVAAGDNGQPGSGCEGQGCRVADPSERLHPDGTQVGAGGLAAWRRRPGRRRSDQGRTAEHPPEAELPLAGCEEDVGRSVGQLHVVEPVEDQAEERVVHGSPPPPP